MARVSKDPRYQQQLYRQAASQRLAAELPAEIRNANWGHGSPKISQRDWSINLGTGASAGAENYPLKYSYDALTANCSTAATPDYVVYGTGLQSTSTNSQASIVAFDNLYTGCTGTVPSTYWAYNTTGSGSTPGTVVTSPIASLDGTQVAFVQTDGLGHGTLVLLKWAANDGSIGSPTAPALDTAAQYASCSAPPACMVQFNLTNPSNVQVDDETSSIYYDFTNDIAWVGDNIGQLHQFHPFFVGTPAEIQNTTWPASISGSWLSSPVYDAGTNNVFVGDGGGYLYAVNASTAAITATGQLDFGTGIIDGPVVDSVNGFVYVFASRDGVAGGCGAGFNKCAAVYQLPTTFSSGATPLPIKIGDSGTATTPNPAYLGGFDSAYYQSGTATGKLYVCGSTGTSPQLFQVPVTAGTLGNAVVVATLTTGTDSCSPVTDVPNPNTAEGPSERVFVSVQNDGFYTACAGSGCVMNFLVSQWLSSTSYSAGQQILDSRFDVETAVNPVLGTSSTAEPTWPPAGTTGGLTTDGTVLWLDQGPIKDAVAAWAGSQSYALDDRVLDSNNNVEIATTPGTSGTGPTWNQTAGGLTPDGTVTWTNAGLAGTTALPAAGGSSGIISDNVVPTTTLAGASQIYFTTLGNQTCTTSGTNGGCAVQASQPALQ
jgi:hypothetical protein